MKTFHLLVMCLVLNTAVQAQNIDTSYNPKHNTIQLALLLDVSNSMDGLINQAKAELWNVVSEVAKATKNGHAARLEIALYEYGRPANDIKNGFIRKHLDYTDDLDTLSEVLFGLTTNGGDEYCGWVIQEALDDLQWRDNDSIYRVIFIAGNEEFNQGKVNYQKSCENGRNKDIYINTIFCGDSMYGVNTFWKHGAEIGNGNYFFINSNIRYSEIWTPYDSLINLYGDSINGTYWNYGSIGYEKKANQANQDKNAMAMSKSVAVKRNIAKSKKSVYKNDKWDVVDKHSSDSTWILKAKDSELPDSMRGKSQEEKRHIIDSLSKSRARISGYINELGTKRSQYIKENQQKKTEKTLGVALIEAIRRQAGEKGFAFVQ